MGAPADQRASRLTWLATAVVVYHLIIVGNLAAWAGLFVPAQVHGAISLAAALALIFLTRPASGGPIAVSREADHASSRRLALVDVVPLAFGLVSLGYVVIFHADLLDYGLFGFLDVKGMVLAALLCVALLEAVRRTTGRALPTLVVVMVLATVFQNVLPGRLNGRGYALDRLLYAAYVGESGIFGLPLNVAATIIIVFVLFGALAETSGAGRWLLRLSLALTGRSRGGPAKAAVVSSALFGSISGSPSANVATTGVFTIPLMTQIGYRAAFAGAVEAVASTGGQILPPVMGAIAFVMAEWIGRPYYEVVVAAVVPAMLYFLVVFLSVHLQACREGVAPLRDLPDAGVVLREGWFYLIPIGALVYWLIVEARPPGAAAIFALPFVVGASFCSRDRRDWIGPRNFMRACGRAVNGWSTIAVITGLVGIMIGAVELSGIGVKVAAFILDVSGGHLVLTLAMVGAASFVLGTGLDSIPVYVTLATLMAPALTALGVSDVAAHLYVVYWGLASFFTPPLCIAVYVALPISGATLWETGWEAVRLGLAAFIVPVAFVLDPGLLLEGSPPHIAWTVCTALAGAALLACAVQGFAFGPLGRLSRGLSGAGGLLMIGPGVYAPLLGAGFGITAMLLPAPGVPIGVRTADTDH